MFKSTFVLSKAILSIILLMSYLINAFPISSQFQPSESIVLVKRSPVYVEQTIYRTTPSTSTEPRTETRTYRKTELENEQKGEKEKAFSGSKSVSPTGKGHLRPIKIEARASSAPSSPVKNSWKMQVDRMHDKVKYHNTQVHVIEPRRLTSVKSESDLGGLTSRRPRVTFATDDQLRKTSRIDHAKSNYPGISSSANVFTRETIETWNKPKEEETQGIDHILSDVSPPTQHIHSTKRWRKGTSERR